MQRERDSVPSLTGLRLIHLAFPALTCRAFLCRRFAAGATRHSVVSWEYAGLGHCKAFHTRHSTQGIPHRAFHFLEALGVATQTRKSLLPRVLRLQFGVGRVRG